MSRAANLTSTANHTKWDELRIAMSRLDVSPAFRCQNLSGYYSPPDSEWFYHFKAGGYSDIRFVDILTDTDAQRAAILYELRRIGFAGHAHEKGFRVYGYAEPGEALNCF